MNENAGLIEGVLAWIQTTLGDARSSIAIIAGTTGVGLAELMGWFQSNVGFIGSVCGVVLAIITIWVQLIVGRKALLEYRILIRKEEGK